MHTQIFFSQKKNNEGISTKSRCGKGKGFRFKELMLMDDKNEEHFLKFVHSRVEMQHHLMD
jgi:hypothetical protein